MLETPLLFLIFNRPDTTERVFNEIRKQKPKYLFVAADGPRTNVAGEAEKCKKTREMVMNAIDWDCELKILFRDSNWGCGPAVSQAITWFFEQVEEGIILEDDTLPDISFFEYCEVLLEKYRKDERVKMIGGNNFQNGKWRGDGSYYFSAYSHIWGWATWRRTWNEYDYKLLNQNETTVAEILNFYFTDRAIKQHWMNIFKRLIAREINTWDLQLLFSIWEKKGRAIAPNVNLVSNIGFGTGATHTSNKKDKLSCIPHTSMESIIHPNRVSIDKDADVYTFYKFMRPKKRFFIQFLKKLKKIVPSK